MTGYRRNGFIGSHLVERLLASGDSVVALDNLSAGRLQNLDAVSGLPDSHSVHASVLDELVVDELVHTCDVVVHLAAAVGMELIVEHPLRSLTTNIRGSEIVIEAAHRYRRKTRTLDDILRETVGEARLEEASATFIT